MVGREQVKPGALIGPVQIGPAGLFEQPAEVAPAEIGELSGFVQPLTGVLPD